MKCNNEQISIFHMHHDLDLQIKLHAIHPHMAIYTLNIHITYEMFVFNILLVYTKHK